MLICHITKILKQIKSNNNSDKLQEDYLKKYVLITKLFSILNNKTLTLWYNIYLVFFLIQDVEKI